jgi:hypothetical protein
MIYSGIGIIDSARYSNEYNDLIDYAIANGICIPSSGQQVLQNQLLLDLKSTGVWDELDVFYIFATDACQNFALLNWKDPGVNTASPQTAGPGPNLFPNFITNQGFQGQQLGFQVNWISTPYNARYGTNFQVNDGSMFVWTFNNQSNNTMGDVGLDTGGPLGNTWGSINPRNASGNAEFNLLDFTNPKSTAAVAASDGLSQISRTSGSSITFYKNGTSLGNFNTTAETVNVDLYLNFLRAQFSAGYSLRTVSGGGMGSALTTQADDLYTAFSDYMSSI